MALLQNYHKEVPMKAHEGTTRDAVQGGATWVQDRKDSKGKPKRGAPPEYLNVLEYSAGLDFILERLNAGQAAHT